MLLLIGISIAIAAVVYFLFFSDVRVNREVLQDLGLQVPENVTGSENGILYKTDENLVLMDLNGKKVWSLPTDSMIDQYVSSGGLICAYGKHTAQFFTYEKQQLFTTTLENTIVSVRCGAQTVGILATAQDADGKDHSFIYTYNLEGKNAGQIDLADKQIIDFGIYEDSDMYWTLSLDTSGVLPASYIVTFKQDGTITGSIEVHSQIVEKVNITSEAIYASGTNSLIEYSYFGEKTDSLLIYGWQPYDMSIEEEKIDMLFSTRTHRTDTISSVKLIDSSLSETMIYFPREIFSAMVNQNGVYAFSRDTIYTYGPDGKSAGIQKLNSPIRAAKKIDSQYAIAWDASTSYLYQLR